MLAARRLFGAAKAGHGGTLDPMASGLLPVLFGEATKFALDLLEADKTYLATIRLGETSTTADAEGTITSTGAALPERDSFAETLRRFIGAIDQLPPMHSALKHEGRPLYDYARKGVEVERKARRVTIHSIELLAFEGSMASLRVVCSKGTYLRTLAQDIGAAAGCGAWLEQLRREAVGSLNLSHSMTLDALEAMDPRERMGCLTPLDRLLASLDRIELDADEAVRFSYGQRLRVRAADLRAPTRVAVYGGSTLLGVATLEGGVVSPVRLLASPPKASSPATYAAPIVADTTRANSTSQFKPDRGALNCGPTPLQSPNRDTKQ